MTGNLAGITLILMILVTLPLKAAAHLADARNTSVGACALAAFIGLGAGYLGMILVGGAIGGPLAAALGFALAIRFVLGTSFFGAIGLMIVALGVSLFGVWTLAELGIVVVEVSSA